MDEERNGWGIFTYDGPIHISPVNEDHIHYPECSCRPVQNEDGFGYITASTAARNTKQANVSRINPGHPAFRTGQDIG